MQSAIVVYRVCPVIRLARSNEGVYLEEATKIASESHGGFWLVVDRVEPPFMGDEVTEVKFS